MKLHSLSLQNFRQHENTRIDFGSGLTGIIGPNGTGKTSILESIAFALYGLDATRGKKETILFSRGHPKAKVEVILDFELSGHRYVIKRGLSSVEMYLEGQVIPLADSVKAVNALVQQKLGMSRDEFFSTFFTGQKELAVMASIGPTERGHFIARVLGYERLKVAQEFVRDARRHIAAELNAVRGSMPDKDQAEAALAAALNEGVDAAGNLTTAINARGAAEAALAALTPRFEASKAAHDSRLRITSDLRVAESELASRVREAQLAIGQLRDAEQAAEELAGFKDAVDAWPRVSGERDEQALLARHDARRRALTDSIADASAEYARLCDRQKVISVAPEMEAAAIALRADKAIEKGHLDRGITDTVFANARAKADAEAQIRSAQTMRADAVAALETITEAGEHGQCPTCFRALEGQTGVVRDALLAQIGKCDEIIEEQRGLIVELAKVTVDAERRQSEALAAEIVALDKRIAKCEAATVELSAVARSIEAQFTRINALRADLETVPSGYDAVKHKALTDELDRLRPLVEQAKKLEGLAGRRLTLATQANGAVMARNEVEARVGALQRDLASLPADDFEAVCDECDRARAAAASANLAHERAIGEQKAASEAVKRAEAAVAQAQESAAREAELVREHATHDALDRAYAELRTDLNKAVRPEIARIASMYLSDLTDGRYTELDLDEFYNLVIIEEGVPKPVVSGGEEDISNLVLRLAISQMIAERSGQSFSLLILDEVFASLDETRRNNVVALLQSLRDRFEQVILITHHDSVRDGCDSVLLVSVDPATGASVLRSPSPLEAVAEPLELAEVGS